MAFEKILIKRNIWHKTGPFVTCTANDSLSFNVAAVRDFSLRDYAAMFVHHDQENNLIAFEPVKTRQPGALAIVGKSEKSPAISVSGFALKSYYNIPIRNLKKAPLKKEGNLLIASLEPEKE
jgi:hypothetical protein